MTSLHGQHLTPYHLLSRYCAARQPFTCALPDGDTRGKWITGRWRKRPAYTSVEESVFVVSYWHSKPYHTSQWVGQPAVYVESADRWFRPTTNSAALCYPDEMLGGVVQDVAPGHIQNILNYGLAEAVKLKMERMMGTGRYSGAPV